MRNAGVFLKWLGCTLISISILSGIEYLTLLAMVLYPLGIVLLGTADQYEISRIDYLEEKMFKQKQEEREENEK